MSQVLSSSLRIQSLKKKKSMAISIQQLTAEWERSKQEKASIVMQVLNAIIKRKLSDSDSCRHIPVVVWCCVWGFPDTSLNPPPELGWRKDHRPP